MTLLENLETEERSYRLTTKEGWIERVQLPERVQPSRLTVGQRQALRLKLNELIRTYVS